MRHELVRGAGDFPPDLTPEQQAVLDLLGRVEALERVVRRLAGCVAVPEFRSIRGQAYGH